MKRTILFFFTIITAFSAYSQSNIQEGDRCFDNGDYICAEAKYNEVYKSSTGKDKQIAEIKITRTQSCAQYLRYADQAFNSKNYRLAKENYQKVLDTNPKDSHAKERIVICESILNPTLSLDKQSLSFTSSGGTSNIRIETNLSAYEVVAIPSWCNVTKQSDHFTITCKPNTGNNTRSDYFKVKAGSKELSVSVKQEGVPQKTKTPNTNTAVNTVLTVSPETLNFDANGGRYNVNLKSNASTYNTALTTGSWYTVTTYSGYIAIQCQPNYGNDRSDWFEVRSGGKAVRVRINQSGTKSNRNYSNSYKKKQCFNCPKAYYSWGVSAGYAKRTLENPDYGYNDVKLNGIQFGIKYEPLFKYGFGLNAGLFYEYYFFDDEVNTYWDSYNMKYEEHHFVIPLHLEYRFNISKYFNIFVYGGASFDVLTNSGFDEYGIQPTYDFGGGIRIDHVQFNVGVSREFTNLKSSTDEFGKNDKDFIVSMSYMF